MVPGTAKAKIKLSLSNDPDSVLITIDYDVTIGNISPTFFINKPKLKVFPNPTTEFFQIQNDQAGKVDEVVVYNLLGRQVRSFPAFEGRQYSLSGLPDGIYLIGLIDDENILANVVSSQLAHTKYGGVVPELAARNHIRTIIPVMKNAFDVARRRLADVELISVTRGPACATEPSITCAAPNCAASLRAAESEVIPPPSCIVVHCRITVFGSTARRPASPVRTE